MTYESISKKHLENRGYTVAITETKGTKYYNNKKDAFGFIDMMAIRSDRPGVLAVQTTSYSNTSHRIKKITTECSENAITWLKAGNSIEVHGWHEDKQGGCRCVEISLGEGGELICT